MKYQVLFSHDEPHSTIDAGIIAEGSCNDGGLAAGTEGVFLEVLDQRVEQDIACAGHAAADDAPFCQDEWHSGHSDRSY